jgi:uncharacterized C2H2 Zn-finger protein
MLISCDMIGKDPWPHKCPHCDKGYRNNGKPYSKHVDKCPTKVNKKRGRQLTDVSLSKKMRTAQSNEPSSSIPLPLQQDGDPFHSQASRAVSVATMQSNDHNKTDGPPSLPLPPLPSLTHITQLSAASFSSPHVDLPKQISSTHAPRLTSPLPLSPFYNMGSPLRPLSPSPLDPSPLDSPTPASPSFGSPLTDDLPSPSRFEGNHTLAYPFLVYSLIITQRFV